MSMMEHVVGAMRPIHFRGKLRLLEGLVPHAGVRRATVHGYQMDLDLGEAIQRWIYMGAFEPTETALVREQLRPGMTFLDVGANVGYFSLLAASRVGPRGRVVAIEPSAHAFSRLNATVEANHIEQVEAFQMGLSDAAGKLPLYVQDDEDGFHSPTMAEGGGRPVMVPVGELGIFLDEHRIESVDLMKMDVEGHEAHVLRGGREALAAGRVRSILCEFNGHWLERQGSSAEELYRLFAELGFQDTAPRGEFGPETFETRFLTHRTAAER